MLHPHHPAVIVWRDPNSGLTRIINVRSARQFANVERLHALHAACLRDIARLTGLAEGPEKHEGPEVAASEPSTAHSVWTTEARAASAQSDTTG